MKSHLYLNTKRLFTRVTPIILGIFALCNHTIQAQITLPPIFADRMVLQQKSEAPIWGWGNASETIQIVGSWSPQDTTKVVVASDGRWKTTLKTGSAGGPFTIHIMGSTSINLQQVMLGEVWLCSGQSNMEWQPHQGLSNQKEEIQSANYPDIRIFTVAKRGADSPQNNCEGKWEPCTPEVMSRSSAVAYFFSRRLQEILQVPVGIIVSAWGGTPAEVWVPKELVDNSPIFSENKPTKTYPWWPIESGRLYNQMIHPLVPFQIAGTIWYQGESNQDHYGSYNTLMKELINAWRKDFGHAFPFYFVQIAPHTYNAPNHAPAFLREQQERTLHETTHTGMIIISDLVNDVKNIHPINKQDVGLRLANMALAKNYAQDIQEYQSPLYKSMQIVKNKIIIEFEHADNGLICSQKRITGLKIAGQDGIWLDANATIKGNTLIVSAPGLKNPAKVSYCFDEATIGNLFSKGNLPVAPFRTDREF